MTRPPLGCILYIMRCRIYYNIPIRDFTKWESEQILRPAFGDFVYASSHGARFQLCTHVILEIIYSNDICVCERALSTFVYNNNCEFLTGGGVFFFFYIFFLNINLAFKW